MLCSAGGTLGLPAALGEPHASLPGRRRALDSPPAAFPLAYDNARWRRSQACSLWVSLGEGTRLPVSIWER